MSRILLVTSSPRGADSQSTRFARDLVRSLQAQAPGSAVVLRDVAAEPLPHIGTDFVTALAIPAEARTPVQARAVAASDAAVEELLAADTLVIAVAMINFGIPSALKTWIDHITRAGRTFRYTETGAEGLAAGRRAWLVLASGGVYSDGPASAQDHALPYLRDLLGFLGIETAGVLRVEGLALGPEAAAQAVAGAQRELGRLARAA